MTDRDIINIALPPRHFLHRRALTFALIVTMVSAAIMLATSMLT